MEEYVLYFIFDEEVELGTKGKAGILSFPSYSHLSKPPIRTSLTELIADHRNGREDVDNAYIDRLTDQIYTFFTKTTNGFDTIIYFEDVRMAVSTSKEYLFKQFLPEGVLTKIFSGEMSAEVVMLNV